MTPHNSQNAPRPTIARQRAIELAFDVADFPVVKAQHFRDTLANELKVTLYRDSNDALYVGRIQLKGSAAKKDGTSGNTGGNLWFNLPENVDTVPTWLLDIVNEACAPYLTTAPAQTADDMTDEELWNSPLGQRLRRYADKLLSAQEARVEFFSKRKGDYIIMAGVQFARDAISPDGTLDERADADPWATYRSDELEGMRTAVKATDGTPAAAHEAAKAYIASLQGDERPAAEMPTTCSGGAAIDHDETGILNHGTDDEQEKATPLDVAGALSYLLTGNPASDRGPFTVHDADGFHDEPYVILSVESMRKVLDEIPESRW